MNEVEILEFGKRFKPHIQAIPNIDTEAALGANGWHLRTATLESALESVDDREAQLIFASLREIAEAPGMIRDRILHEFGVPSLLLDRVCLESNGFSGCETILNGDGIPAQHNYWSRFVVKQTHQRLRPKRSFIEHPAWQEPQAGNHAPTCLNPPPIHGSQSVRHGWEWYEMGFFVRWTPPSSTTILCFDLPRPFQISVQSALRSGSNKIELSDPYAVFTVILHQLLSLYDDSVWSIRNHICRWEAERQEEPDYPLLHEVARHAIHVSETLAVAFESVKDIQQQHREFRTAHCQSDHSLRHTQNPLQFPLRLLSGLLSRAESNKARLQNETQLAFHTAAQRDSRIQVRIGEDAKKETNAMKAIAVITMTFLPATFLSSVFSTPFFRFERAEPGGEDEFIVSSLFWVYWTLAIPLSLLVFGLWVFWDWRKGQAGEPGRARGNVSAWKMETPV